MESHTQADHSSSIIFHGQVFMVSLSILESNEQRNPTNVCRAQQKTCAKQTPIRRILYSFQVILVTVMFSSKLGRGLDPLTSGTCSLSSLIARLNNKSSFDAGKAFADLQYDLQRTLQCMLLHSMPTDYLSAIPIGAYEPRWFMKAQHVDPEEALKVKSICKNWPSVSWGSDRCSHSLHAAHM